MTLVLLAVVAVGAAVAWLRRRRTGIDQREWSRAIERVQFNRPTQEK